MTLKSYPKRWFLIGLAMAITFMSGWLWFLNGRLFEMMWWWMLIPLWSVLAFGNMRSRVVNGLPLFVLWLYGLLSIVQRDLSTYLYVFYFTPYVSLMVKPQRHPIKYVTMVFSTVALLYGLLTQNPVALPIRISVVVLINVLFFPPYLWVKLKQIGQKSPRSS